MTNGVGIKVKKRSGAVEALNLDKIHKMVEEACEGLGSGVSASQVEMNSGLQFFDGIETKDIQEILVRSASDLISLESPNYQFVLLVCFCLQFVSKSSDHRGLMDIHLFLITVTVVLRKVYMIKKLLISILTKSGLRLILGLIMNEICYLPTLVCVR